MEFKTKVVGVTFDNRQKIIEKLCSGDGVWIEKTNNSFDDNAIAVMSKYGQLGFLSRELAENVRKGMKEGIQYKTEIIGLTGEDKEIRGVNISIKKID